jgi:hypothetical protein
LRIFLCASHVSLAGTDLYHTQGSRGESPRDGARVREIRYQETGGGYIRRQGERETERCADRGRNIEN